MDLASLATASKAKSGVQLDVSALNTVLNLVDEKKVRLTYQTFQFLAEELGVMPKGRASPVGCFHLLDHLKKPWLVCKNNGGYKAIAILKFRAHLGEEEFAAIAARPQIKIENAPTLLEMVTAK